MSINILRQTKHLLIYLLKMHQMGQKKSTRLFMVFLVWLQVLTCFVYCQLDYRFYDTTCPNLTRIVRYGVISAIRNETRMAASLLRMHFHDCFVNGCDASLLLDDAANITSEKNARPNVNSVRGFEVIDSIKANVEKLCPSTVSCADIVTIAAREAVYISGGPYWSVALGRRDGTTADPTAANQELPSPFDSLSTITSKFAAKGLDVKDVVALSGAHTIGFAQCFTFKNRLFNFNSSGEPDPSLHSSLLASLQKLCPDGDAGSNSNLAALDPVTTSRFDNVYYRNLMNSTGLLQSDQALMEDSDTASRVSNYSRFPLQFFKDFGDSMVKMSKIGVLTGQNGEIRTNCRVVN